MEYSNSIIVCGILFSVELKQQCPNSVNIYNKLYGMFSFIAIILSLQLFSCAARINIKDKGVQPLERSSIGLMFYINVENESYLQQYSISSRRERCCLRVDVDQMDCSSADLVGGKWLLKPKEKKSLILVYPTVFQHDKVGVCTLLLFTKCGKSSTITTRQVHIPFDTRIFGRPNCQKNNLFNNYYPTKKAHRCISSDDDTMNECQPVNCEIKYGGNRSYFDTRVRRCVPAVPCFRTLSKTTPDVVYIPSGNICRNLEQPLSTGDLYSLSMGANTVVPSERFKKSNDVHVVCNCTTMSQFLRYGIDVLYGRHGESHACLNERKVALLAVCALVFTACWQLGLCVIAMVLVLKLREMWQDGSLRKNASSAAYYLTHLRKKSDTGKKRDQFEDKNDGATKKILLKEILTVAQEEQFGRSASQLCERMSREISSSRRYRNEDVGSQISLNHTRVSSSQKLQKGNQRN